MSRKPESTFIASVHNHLDRIVYRMKNHNAYVAGIADVWYSAIPNDLWVEYKFITAKNPRDNIIPKLSVQQLRWIRDRKEEGRDVWIIVGKKEGGVIYKDIKEMEFGIPPDEFLERTLSRKSLALEIYTFCTMEPTNATT